jgi:hypothetical protein
VSDLTDTNGAMLRTFLSFCLLTSLVLWPVGAWSADATGFSVTLPCGSPPFGSGESDMHLYLTHFPKQRPGQELVVLMPSQVGPAGLTDWVDAVAKLCNISDPISCSDAKRARVRVLNYSGHHSLGHISSHHISGRFEVGFADGTTIEGTFAAKERETKQYSQAICE